MKLTWWNIFKTVICACVKPLCRQLLKINRRSTILFTTVYNGKRKKKKKQYGDGLSQHKVSHATYPISLYVDIICINIFIYLFNSCMNVSPTFPGSLVLFHNFYYIYTRENEQSKNLHNFQKVGTNMHLSIWLQSSILCNFSRGTFVVLRWPPPEPSAGDKIRWAKRFLSPWDQSHKP